jgi:hypothetical protein
LRKLLIPALLCLAACGAGRVRAQLVHTDTLTATADTLLLRLPNLVPFSEQVFTANGRLDTTAYALDYFRGRLALKDVRLKGQRLVVTYRTFENSLPLRTYFLRRPPGAQPDTIKPEWSFNRLPSYYRSDTARRFDFFEPSRLQRSGSISRAVTIGTNSDLAVNGDFRLQLNGTLGNDVEISAAMTDQNIPIQPSGTTQQITDFDRIFIQLRKGRYFTTFGDMDLQYKNTQFSNIFRNVQGVMVGAQGGNHSWSLSGAVSKGKFNTNSFQGENGKQGPYRLQGRQNERFIIILAGSERVYINGVRMTRGEDRDYVIEYNTAQIVFTPNRVIDVNTRIVVDFEYLDQNYARTLIFGQYQGKVFKDKLGIRASYGREADDPATTFNLTLGQRELDALRQAGAQATQASISGVDSVGYNAAEVRYIRKDTTLNAQTYRGVFVRSTDAQRAVFRVTFTFVGAGNGDYIRENNLANNNSFRWSSPDAAGRPTGDYAPIRILPAPRALQVGNLALDYDLTKHLHLYTETAVSADNPNQLSNIGRQQNVGAATRTGVRLQNLPLSQKLSVSTDVAVQYVDRQFQNFDRVYKFEYGRDWNFNDLGGRATERLVDGTTELKWQDLYRVRLGAGYRLMGDSLSTRRYSLELESKDSTGLQGKNLLVYLSTADNAQRTLNNWLRNNGDVFYNFWRKQKPLLKLGTEVWIEDRRNQVNGDDAVGTFTFFDLKPYLRSSGKRKLQYDLSFNYRYDREFQFGAMRGKSITYKPALSINYAPSGQFGLRNTATYFNYALLDTAFLRLGLQNQQSFTNQLQATVNSKNRLLQSSAFYEVATERIARQQVNFIRVNAGLGQFQWIDYNNDGIQQLNEFEIAANPLTANYIRILTPTNQLFPVVRVSVGFNLRLDFARLQSKELLASKRFLPKLVRNISSVTNARVEQRRAVPTDRLDSYWLSTANISLTDTNMLSAAISLRQDLFFYRGNPDGDFSFSYLANNARQFLNSGAEERSQQTLVARQRVNFDPARSIENTLQYGVRINQAQLFPTRNFNIQFITASPVFNYQFSRRVRVSGGYEFKYKRNTDLFNAEANAILNTHKLLADARINYGERNNIIGKLELLDNQLRGAPSNSAQFELLEGLRPGRNVVWNLLFSQYLSRLLELSIIYDGRSAEGQPTLHSARFQLKAIF